MKIIVEKPVEGREVVDGVIAVNANNPEFGSIMLSQTNFALNVDGFMNQEKRVTFISGRIDALKQFVKDTGITPGCDYSQKTGIPHRLVVVEQTTPFFEGQSPKVNPKTNEPLHTIDGELIYRRVSLVPENSENAVDTLVQHVRQNVTVNTTVTTTSVSTVE
jgi:hypothetical protein